MSQLAITQHWMEEILTAYISIFAGKMLKVRLFKNDYQPDDSSEFDDFDECDWSGYDGARDVETWSLGGIAWVAPRMVLPGPTATWETASGGVTNIVYGYYVTDDEDNLLWAERIEDPQIMGSIVGQTIAAELQYSVRSEFHSTV